MSVLSFRPVSVTLTNVTLAERPTIEAKLAKVNKRLAKIGAPAATVTFGPQVTGVSTDEFGFEFTTTAFEWVTVTGAEAKLAGWTAVASLDHTYATDEAVVSRFPGQFDTVIPDGFRTRGPVCDHCGVRMNRNLTILFVSDTGTWTQVGTTCVLEFIGVDPATILWLAGPQFGLLDDEGEGGGSGRRDEVAPAYFLAVAAEVTREVGFRPTSFDDNTRDLVSEICFSVKPSKRVRELLPNLDPARGKTVAAEVLAWVADLPGRSDFEQSAQLACRADKVGPRTAGLLACLPNAFVRATAEKMVAAAKATATRPASFLGTVGQKLTVTGTVVLTRTFESDYYGRANSYLVVVQTPDGDKVSTFGSGQTLYLAEQGATVTITGKVVEHSDGQYGAETKLKLAKVAVVAEATA